MNTIRFALLTAFVLCTCAGAGAATPADRATLTVTGEASVTRAPDRARVTFAVQTTDASSAVATSANATITNALVAKMTQLGLPPSAVVTTGYALSDNPRPSKPDPANDQRYGTTVTRTIDVTVDAIDRAGAIVDAGVAAGATGVNGVSFELRDPRAAERSAQAAAVADALLQARGLAVAAGVRIGRIRSISPGGGIPTPRLMRMAPMALAASVPTTIDAGNLTVAAQVTVQYEIAP